MRRHRRDSDEEGRLILREGDVLNNQYTIIGFCGEGTYSNVYKCLDKKTSEIIVIKVCRSNSTYAQAASDEIKTMEFLKKIDPMGQYFVKYFGYFFHGEGNICIMCELLGPSLFEVMKYNHFKPFSHSVIKSFAKQIIESVDLLHQNEKIHTDLKLENILMKKSLINLEGLSVETRKPELDIRIIDFGSLDTGNKWHSYLATTRHYRAPEILLGLKWGYECDVWSIGCILLELAYGSIVFDSKDNLEHLYLIQELISPFPKWMLDDCKRESFIPYLRKGYISSRAVFDENQKKFARYESLKDQLIDTPVFYDFLSSMLNPDPSKRSSLTTLRKHQYLND